MKLTMRRAFLATAGVVAAGGLVLGGTEAFASTPGSVNSAASTQPSSSETGNGSGNAACKQTDQARPNKSNKPNKPSELNKQGKPRRHPRGCDGREFGRRGHGGAWARFNHGVHGQASVKGDNGAITVHEWQVGKVTSVNSNAVTVTDASGTTWTWTVQSSTRYRIGLAAKPDNGGHAGHAGQSAPATKGSISDVHTGDNVFVRGVQNGSANDVTALLDAGSMAPTP